MSEVKSDAALRRNQERRAAERAGEPIMYGPVRDDTAAVIHQEIDRLPERYRRPVVLCYLEDMTYQQAADQLRWSEATTRGRLARARDLLRTRLTRRGVTLAGAGLSLAAGSSPSMASAVPAALLRASVRAARHIGLGESAAVAAVSSAAIVLMKHAARTMMIARLKAIAAAALIVSTLTGLATGLTATVIANPEGLPQLANGSPASRAVAGQAKVVERETIEFRGRVLAPDGKPAEGAGVYTVADRPADDSGVPRLRAKAAADGTFRFAITRDAFDTATGGEDSWSSITVLAAADGLGPDWVELSRPPNEELTLRLVDDSVPIAGRILDLQGRPVVGAKVTRGTIEAEGAEGIERYLKLLRDDPSRSGNHRFARTYWGYALPGRSSNVVTDVQGRFRLTGIGRDRIVRLAIEGPNMHYTTITAMTRGAATASTPNDILKSNDIYTAAFDYLISPGRVLTGVVRDKRTRRPLAGVEVSGDRTNARTTTDAEGRYSLPGFPKGKSYGLIVSAGDKPPYFMTFQVVSNAVGLDPIKADVECLPGIPMRLKPIDKETGQPPKRAEVTYWPLHPNPHTREVSGYARNEVLGSSSVGVRQDDGTYLLGVLPGPGAVFVWKADGDYRPACVDPAAFFQVEKIDAARRRENRLYGDRNTLFVAAGEGGAADAPQELRNAIVLINPPKDSDPITAEAVLERDRKREVRVLDPDGKPLTGVTVEGKGAVVTKMPGVISVSKLNPMRPKRFTFRHDDRKLVGFLLARGDEAEPYTVRLHPWGTIIGRLIDAEDKPRPGALLMTIDWQDRHDDPASGILSHVKTDAEGRFRVQGLVPG